MHVRIYVCMYVIWPTSEAVDPALVVVPYSNPLPINSSEII